MNRTNHYPYFWREGKKENITQFQKILTEWRSKDEKVITTNGCFDLLHSGHITFMSDAKKLGDRLVVGLNSDSSVTRIKGAGKPLVGESERATVLSALRDVDAVIVFDDLLPDRLLEIIKPDIHCKAGDYSEDSLPEAEIVRKNGGKIAILPVVEGVSSSRILERMISGRGSASGTDFKNSEPSNDHSNSDYILTYLLESSNLYRQSAYKLKDAIEQALERVTNALQRGNKLLLCGNGGSAADAQHIAAEFVGRFKMDRNALPAIALTTDTSILTAISNDYGFDQIFARQVDAIGAEGDLLIAISTSGNSENVLKAVDVAKKKGIDVIGLTGNNSSSLQNASDIYLAVPSDETAMVQQVHIGLLHLLCDLTEKQFKIKGS